VMTSTSTGLRPWRVGSKARFDEMCHTNRLLKRVQNQQIDAVAKATYTLRTLCGTRGALAVQDELDLDDGDGKIEVNGQKYDDDGGGHCRNSSRARSKLEHRPGLEKEHRLDENGDGETKDGRGHADVVVDPGNELHIARHDRVELEPAGGEEKEKESHTDDVERGGRPCGRWWALS
jgi:hypothetical protein